MKEYFHHNYGCHHRTMQSCDCSRDSCSSNSCCCSHGGHQDKCGGNSITITITLITVVIIEQCKVAIVAEIVAVRILAVVVMGVIRINMLLIQKKDLNSC